MKKILLIEDCEEVQILVKQSLAHHYKIDVAGNYSEACELLKNNYDMFLVDVMLPDEDGFKLCAFIRSCDQYTSTPIIFLTSKSDIADKIMGFAVGADDYVLKPFNLLELKARIDSKLKRLDKLKIQTNIIFKGSIKICVEAQKVYVLDNGRELEVQLTPNEFKLLHFFSKNEGAVLSRDKLLNALWSDKINVLDRTVDAHVCQLRKKLLNNAHYIESIVGEGYRFSIPAHSPV